MILAQAVVNETNFPPAKIVNFAVLLNIVLPLLSIGAALIFLVMLLFGAFTWLTAGNKPENLKKAQSIIMSAIIGLVIVILSFVIVKIIGVVFNISNIIPTQ